MLYGSKFVETGAGIGHNIDTLLVGIAVQARWVVARGVNKISRNSLIYSENSDFVENFFLIVT